MDALFLVFGKGSRAPVPNPEFPATLILPPSIPWAELWGVNVRGNGASISNRSAQKSSCALKLKFDENQSRPVRQASGIIGFGRESPRLSLKHSSGKVSWVWIKLEQVPLIFKSIPSRTLRGRKSHCEEWGLLPDGAFETSLVMFRRPGGGRTIEEAQQLSVAVRRRCVKKDFFSFRATDWGRGRGRGMTVQREKKSNLKNKVLCFQGSFAA